jgi:acetyl-CoA acetyltransferase
MQPVYLAGVGITKFGNDPRSLVEILCQAAQQALKETQVQTVDALYIGAMNPEEFTGDNNIASQMAEELGLSGNGSIGSSRSCAMKSKRRASCCSAHRSGSTTRCVSMIRSWMPF